ncbi:MAG: hypothetical protein JWM47_4528 [Acidimicrobiales bacterium]|nr:hypothetical protein [Acidimicrobiales bacterium]
MARTALGAALTREHYRGQLQVRAAALRDFTRLWPIWDGSDKAFGHLVSAAIPVVTLHHGLSRDLAAGYFQAFRRAERVNGTAAPRLAPEVDYEALAGTLYKTGRNMTRDAVYAGKSPQAARQLALIRTSGTLGRFALLGGRDTLVASSEEDKKTEGWVRVTGDECCSFCAMLASNGPTYSEEGSGFEAHDHCSCSAEPSYAGSEWPGRAREFRDLWDAHAKNASEPLTAFRQALAGQAG